MTCRYSAIKDFDINQADGVSVSLWMQGCEFRCTGCHNEQTWDFEGGSEFTYKTIEEIIYLLTKDGIKKSLSILGGESLSPNKIPMITELVKCVKSTDENIRVWIWTGYIFEDIKHLELINYIDVLVDGQYIEELHDVTRYKGSENQRVIDVYKSKKENEIILYKN